MDQPTTSNKRTAAFVKAARAAYLRSAFVIGFGVFLHSTTIPAQAQERSPNHQAYCLELEKQLAKSMYGGTIAQDRAKLQIDLRNIEKVYHRLQNEAERYRCYSHFLFSKELRRTPRCVRIHKKIRSAKSQLSSLNRALNRSANSRSNERYRQDKIIKALARNNCGPQYIREARKRNSFSNWFGGGFFGGSPRNYRRDEQFTFATHRTMCVRLCDGYYFPISFATTSNRFSTDEHMCQSRCAAPARLFTYPNPGGTPEQMLSVDGISYNEIENAWRFKKEFVKGCSCKTAEYNPVLLEKKLQTPEENNEKQSSQLHQKEQAPLSKETASKNQIIK